MNTPIRIAVIGCGVIGKEHIERISKDDRYVLDSLCDLNAELLKEVADQYKPEKTFSDTEAFLAADSYDAVVLALPTLYRRDLTLKLIEAGKHLLIEKPISLNGEDLAAFQKLAGPDQKIACCSSRFSNSKALQQGRQWIEDGKIGDLRMIRCRGILAAGPAKKDPPNWRIKKEINGGGILSNWGTYDLDFVFALTGWKFEPKKVNGRVFQIASDCGDYYHAECDVESHALCFAEDANGVVLNYERAENYPGEGNSSWEILGTKGSISMNMLGPIQGVTCQILHSENGPQKLTASFPEDEPFDFHGEPLDNFAKAIRGDAELLTDLERSAIIVRLMDAIYESSETGKTIQT